MSRAKYFRSLTYKNQGISTVKATQIYATICRPLIEYGSFLLLNARNPAWKNVSVGETGALRQLTKIRNPNNPLHNPSNIYLYSKIRIQPIQERTCCLARRFAAKHKNMDILRPMCRTRTRPGNPSFKYPEETLWEWLQTQFNQVHEV